MSETDLAVAEQMESGLGAGQDDDSDAGLIARAVAGDRAAFGRLLSRHYDTIYRFAYRWTGHQSDAEDVAQEVCVKLASVLKSFDGRARFTSWLYRIVLNAVRDMQRQRGRGDKRVAALSLVVPHVDEGDQERAVGHSDLWAAVRSLPPKQRDAMLLIYAQEMSHAEAATIMGCSEKTVSWHVFEAKKKLKELV